MPAVENYLSHGAIVQELPAHVGNVVAEVVVNGMAAVLHVLRQFRIDKLKQRGLAGGGVGAGRTAVGAGSVVNDRPRERVVDVPLQRGRRGGSTASAASCSCSCSCW